MSINFRSSEAGQFMILKEALRSFNEKDTDFRLYAMWGHSLKIPRCFKLFSHFLSDIIDSCPLVQEVPTIILPDFPVNSIKHLINLLTKGSTLSQDDQDVEDIIEIANVLNIDIKNLVYDEHTIKQGKPPVEELEDLEEGETEDGEEHKLKFVKKIGIQIASFAKANSFNPNIMTNGKNKKKKKKCKKSFGSEAALETHLKMTCEHLHGNEEDNLPMAQEPKLKVVQKIETHKASLDGSNPNITSGRNIDINFQCPECKLFLENSHGLETHLKMKHGHDRSKKKCRCDICCKVFWSTSKLLAHKEIHKICEVCGKKFLSIKSMLSHFKIDHGCEPYKCNFCHFAFSQRTELKMHIKNLHW